MLINVKKNKEYIVKGKALFGAVSTINVNDYFHNNHVSDIYIININLRYYNYSDYNNNLYNNV